MNDKLKLLKDILLNKSIEENEEIIFALIPELKSEKNFDQKSQWHDLDVWHHTIKAVNSCDKNFYDRLILLLHDIGKPFSYQDDGDKRHFRGHAQKSKEISKPILERLGIDNERIYEMINLIGAHADKIDLRTVTSRNLAFYKHLCKIKKCDGSAYEKNHSKMILKDLENVELCIEKISEEIKEEK